MYLHSIMPTILALILKAKIKQTREHVLDRQPPLQYLRLFSLSGRVVQFTWRDMDELSGR